MTIFQPNLTFRHGGHQAPGFQVQSENWMYEPDACGRPPVEVQQSIICGTCFVIDSPYITSTAGGDWDLFSPCCPYQYNGTASGKTAYYSARNCTESYCLTSNESVANNWDQCVKDLARNGSGNGVDVFANQTVDEAYCGRCEFLDQDFLKNGLVKSGTAASAKTMTASVLLFGLLAGAMLL